MRKIVKIILIFFSSLTALLLLLTHLSVYINPEFFWPFALLGLAYPALVLLNFLFLVFWATRWKIHFIAPLLAFLIGVGSFVNFFQFPFGKKEIEPNNGLKIMSYNVNLFQLFAWSKEQPTYNDIFSFINEEDPDIICLQEFYTHNKRFSETDAQGRLKSHVHIGHILKNENTAYGLATYSKYPIIKKGTIRFENSFNACIYTDILIDSDTLRVYNTHFQSLRLKEHNLNFLMNQGYLKNAQPWYEIKDISIRYRDALKKRAQQVNMVTGHILSSPYPALVCGDFNESPISYNYHKMRKHLDDAFVDAGVGMGHTYRGFTSFFRIDYILYHKSYKAVKYRRPKVEFSDHYPIIATLEKKE